MNKWEISLLIFSIIYTSFESHALKCFVCRTKEIAECHDLRDTNLRAQECTGTLKWNEKFACFVNSSMVNNFIETDRRCLIINTLSNPCLGKISPNKFGRCRVCYEDECNNENENNVKNRSQIIFGNWRFLVAIYLVILVS